MELNPLIYLPIITVLAVLGVAFWDLQSTEHPVRAEARARRGRD